MFTSIPSHYEIHEQFLVAFEICMFSGSSSWSHCLFESALSSSQEQDFHGSPRLSSGIATHFLNSSSKLRFFFFSMQQ